MKNFDPIAVSLPSLNDVGRSVYQRAYHDRLRLGSLLETAALINADLSMVKPPESWEELKPAVSTVKAIVSKRRAYLKSTRPLLKGEGSAAYAEFMGLVDPS